MTATVIRGPWPGLTAADKRPGAPPTPEYLAMRKRLGMPSQPQAPMDVQRPCSWCGASSGEACTVRATGKRLQQPHEARQDAP